MAFTPTNVLSKARIVAWTADNRLPLMAEASRAVAASNGFIKTAGIDPVSVIADTTIDEPSKISSLYMCANLGGEILLNFDLPKGTNIVFGASYNASVVGHASPNDKTTISAVGSMSKITLYDGIVKMIRYHKDDMGDVTLEEVPLYPFGYSSCDLSLKESKGDELCLSWAHTGYVQDKMIEINIPAFGLNVPGYEKTDESGVEVSLKRKYIYLVQITEEEGVGVAYVIQNENELDIELTAQANNPSLTNFIFRKSIPVDDNSTLRILGTSDGNQVGGGVLP